MQQEPSAETTEGTGISISCSHPNIQSYDFILWYRQLLGRSPAFLVSGTKGSQELRDPAGRLSVAADRRSSALWLARPRRGDAAVYYCALGDTGRGAGAAAGQEPRRAGPGVCVGGGGTAPGGPARGRCRSARPRPAPVPPSTGTGSLDPSLSLSLLLPLHIPCLAQSPHTFPLHPVRSLIPL